MRCWPSATTRMQAERRQRGDVMQLSQNFTLQELVRSHSALRLGIDNTPDADVVASLERLCLQLLEPASQISTAKALIA